MKKTSGPKREAVTKEGWRKVSNEEFHDLYSSPDIVQDEVAVVYDTYKGKRDACRVSVGKPVGKRPLGRPQT
jgi:hypothetical protein